jgi:phosphoglycolate phosphatase
MSGAPEPRALRAIVFDFDHTLTDLGRWVDWRGARDEVIALYEAEQLDVATITHKKYAFGAFQALDDALAARASRLHADAVRDRALAVLDRYEHVGAASTGWLRGVATLLDTAAEHGLDLAIVSANGESPIRAALTRLAAADRFATIIGRSPSFAPKPAPDMHLEVLRRLGCPPSAALAIGDSPNDMRAATAAGILTIGVLGGEGTEAKLFESGATWVLEDLTALPALLALWTGAV